MTLSPLLIDQTMLKVLVGSSYTHGLAGPESDKDFRSVFVTRTADMFRPGFKQDCSAALIAAYRAGD